MVFRRKWIVIDNRRGDFGSRRISLQLWTFGQTLHNHPPNFTHLVRSKFTSFSNKISVMTTSTIPQAIALQGRSQPAQPATPQIPNAPPAQSSPTPIYYTSSAAFNSATTTYTFSSPGDATAPVLSQSS